MSNYNVEMKKRNARYRGATESYKYLIDAHERIADFQNAYENIENTRESLGDRNNLRQEKDKNAARITAVKRELDAIIKEVS